jgi:Uma2 family endonuclease
LAIATRKPRQSRTGRHEWPEWPGLPIVLRLHPVLELSEDQFFEFCQINRDVRIERNAEGELLIMSPAVTESGGQNAEVSGQLWLWAKRDGTGKAFDSSTGFTLPNGAVRAPDAAWIANERWGQISAEDRKRFARICPDFVLELRSPSDRLRDLQDKLEEYIANGARLGWLLDPETRLVHVYRPDAAVEQLDNPDTVAGDPVLPGFVLDLREVW